jgi:hypothetical protein
MQLDILDVTMSQPGHSVCAEDVLKRFVPMLQILVIIYIEVWISGERCHELELSSS